MKLCEVSVPAGAINIRQAQITDTRAISEVCGFVTGVIDQIDASDLFLQFQAQFSDFMSMNYEEFETWFDYMKDQLSTDAAAHLQNELDEQRIDITILQTKLGGWSIVVCPESERGTDEHTLYFTYTE